MKTDRPLPISVIIPTMNCIAEIPEHIKALNRWITEVNEVIVIDSESNDGTMECLKQDLTHPNITFINHPPGLYQSWNAAIQVAKSKYVYVATVSDKIAFTTLEKLYQTAESSNADAVLSAPNIISPDGKKLNKKWPLHRFIESRGLTEPYCPTHLERLIHNTINLPGTLIGSSASNLYKTETLQTTPFPLDCGNTGDSAWAIQQSLMGVWMIIPNLQSKFVFHSNRGIPADIRQKIKESCYKQAAKTWNEFFEQDNNRNKYQDILPLIKQLHRLWSEKSPISQRLKQQKKKSWPWFLSLVAWKLRCQQKTIETQIHIIQRKLFNLK